MPVYPGLDISTWDDRLVWLWQHSNLRFSGFYLAHGAGDTTTTWTNHWHDLRDLGWGAFPLWVPFSSTAVDHGMRTSNGGAHGTRAANLARAARIEKGAVIYLDIESPLIANGTRTVFGRYVADWMTAVQTAGYRPGAYCSRLDATVNGLLSQDFYALRPVLFPFSIPNRNRANFDRDSFTLPPALPDTWIVGPDRDWPHAAAVIGAQYDWYNAQRAEKSFNWPDAAGRRDPLSARSVDWDSAKVFDPTHPRAAGTVALAVDTGVRDSAYVYVVRPGKLSTSGRGRTGRLEPSIDLRLTAGSSGPTPSPQFDGFDASGAAAVSRRAGHQDVFMLGLDGYVRTSWVNPRETHVQHSWVLNPRDPARKGSPLAAVSRVMDRLDVFYVDRAHHVVNQWWHPSTPDWATQRRTIGGPPVAGGSNLSALPAPSDAQPTPDRLDVFYVTFDHSLPSAVGSDWNDRWQVAHLAWTPKVDWQTRTIVARGGVAGGSGVAAIRDSTGALRVIVQRRDRTGLHCSVLAAGSAAWVDSTAPGSLPVGWWMNLELIAVGNVLLLAGMSSEASLAWTTWDGRQWSRVATAAAEFSTGRPLVLAGRGPAAVDVIGLTEDGELTMRSLEVLANGAAALRP